jgi:hypothetical protein
MSFGRLLAAQLCICLLTCLHSAATNLVTGNGFGFAVVSPETAFISKFYAHPFSFVRPDPQNPLSEGGETANFIKSLCWIDSAANGASADYEEDSHVIHARSRTGEGFFFMPFGLQRSALIIWWEPGSVPASPRGFKVEWSRPVTSRKVTQISNTEVLV